MEIKKQTIEIEGKEYVAELQWYDVNDRITLEEIFNLWSKLKKKLNDNGYRSTNIPEGVSEFAFSLEMKCPRLISLAGGTSSSFDCYDVKNKKRVQVKASTKSGAPSSFGPTSVWDVLYFMDFSNGGNVNGNYMIYKIPSNLVYERQVNNDETFQEQQRNQRRPRFSINKLIQENKLMPIFNGKILYGS